MKIKRIIALLLTLFTLLNMVVYAKNAGDLSVKYTPLTSTVMVSGKSGTVSGTAVNLLVLKKGDILGNVKPVSVVIGKTIAGGMFESEIILSKNIAFGEYTVYAISAKIKETADFTVPDKDKSDDILLVVNKAVNENAVKAAITDYKALGLTDEEYSDGAAASLILAKRPQEGYASYHELLASARAAYVCINLNNGTNQEYLLKKYEDELKISYSDYEKLTESEKTELLGILKDLSYNEEEFNKLFYDSIILSEIKTAVSWVKMREVIVHNEAQLGTDMASGSEYSKVTNTDEVFRSLYEKRASFKGLKDVKTEFDSIVDKMSEKSESSSGGSSSGGSSSSSSTVKVTAGVTSSHTVRPEAAEKKSDIDGHWANAYITNLVNKGYMKGYGDGTFKPDAPVTRAEFLKLAECIVSIPDGSGSAFLDVKETDWFFNTIARFEKAGIAKGSDGYFNPNSNITRQDAATLIYRIMEYAGKAPEDGQDRFTDDIAAYALQAVNAMANAGILSGNGEAFLPINNTTRAEAAVIISKVIEYITKEAISVPTVDNTKNADKADKYLKEAVACIEGLGFSADFAMSDAVTRAEFVKLLVGLTKAEIATGSASPFQDVTDSTDGKDEIVTAYILGYLEADEKFLPDDAISGYDALRMVVKALGYDEITKAIGTFPTNYIQTANNIKLTKNITGINDSPISGRNAAVLLLRMLTTGVMDMASYSESGTEYVRSSDKTILTETWELTRIEGTVTATSYASIMASGALSEKEHIMIDGESYGYTGNNVDIIGRNVSAYIDDNENIVIIVEDDNNTLTVYEPTGYTSGRLEYEEGSSKKRANTVSSVIAVHNGKVYSGDVDSLVKRDDVAKIELVDNDDDSKYDIIFVTTAKYMRFSSFDLKTRTIYANLYGESFSAKLSEDVGYIFTDGGKVVEPYKMIEGEYWALSQSDDGDICIGYKILNSKKAVVTGMDTEYIITDKGEFEIEKSFAASGTTVPLGISSMLYFTDSGKVFATEAAANSDYSYAYVIRSFYDEENERYSLKLLNADGEFKRYSFAKRVVIDGISTEENRDIKAAILDDGNNVKQGIIKVKIENDEICGIDLVAQPKVLYSKNKPSNNSLEVYYDKERLTYLHASRSFPQFRLAGCEAVFLVPDYNEATSFDEDDFKLGSIGVFGDRTAYSMDAYDINEEGGVGALVVYGYNVALGGSATKSALIESVNEIYDEEVGTTLYEVRAWVEGVWNTYKAEEEKLLIKETGKRLSAGDVIRFSLKGNNILDEVIIDFDEDTMSSTGEGKNYFHNDTGVISYNIVSAYKRNKDIVIGSYTKAGKSFDYSVKNLRTFDISGAMIVLFDRETQQIEPGDSTDINDYLSAGENASTLLIRHRYFDCRNMCVIYR